MECFYFVYNSERNYYLNIETFNHQTYNPKVMETYKFSFLNKKMISLEIFSVFDNVFFKLQVLRYLFHQSYHINLTAY